MKLTDYSSGGGCGCKIPSNILQKYLKNLEKQFLDKNLLVGNSKSDDAAIYKINSKEAIVASTDFFTPIVNDPYEFGRISATNAISDIYAMGAKPLFALAILAVPSESINNKLVKKIILGGKDICRMAGIVVAGGHTIKSSEIIYGLSVIGITKIKSIKTNDAAKDGDQIILTKPLGIGVISSAIKKNMVQREHYKSMISNCIKLNKPGYYLGKKNLITSMTDVTGFGLLGHLKEICIASNKKAKIYYNLIPTIPGVKELIKKNIYTAASNNNWLNTKNFILKTKKIGKTQKIFLTDPQTSGGLLISCKKIFADQIIKYLKNNKFENASIIGEFSKSNPSIEII